MGIILKTIWNDAFFEYCYEKKGKNKKIYLSKMREFIYDKYHIIIIKINEKKKEKIGFQFSIKLDEIDIIKGDEIKNGSHLENMIIRLKKKINTY